MQMLIGHGQVPTIMPEASIFFMFFSSFYMNSCYSIFRGKCLFIDFFPDYRFFMDAASRSFSLFCFLI